jgi:mannose-6-phosphate isomerase-like protein (cupin superfamily)
MEIFNLKNFIKGWIIGDFEPTLLKTSDFEVSVKRYKAGDYEKSHHHKLATEYTIIVEGVVEMNNQILIKDNIIKIEPNESTDFECLSDAITVVIKTPSVNNDKYINE